ncbi:MAG: nucleotidyltransferase domain-containing protein [Acidimicrobiales bacterium]
MTRQPGPWIERLRDAASFIAPAPAALMVFGSVARGNDGPDSDLDVLAVRATGVAFDDDDWADSLAVWSATAWEVTGRPVALIDADEDEIPELLGRPGDTVWRRIAREGAVIAGRSLAAIGSLAQA